MFADPLTVLHFVSFPTECFSFLVTGLRLAARAVRPPRHAFAAWASWPSFCFRASLRSASALRAACLDSSTLSRSFLGLTNGRCAASSVVSPLRGGCALPRLRRHVNGAFTGRATVWTPCAPHF